MPVIEVDQLSKEFVTRRPAPQRERQRLRMPWTRRAFETVRYTALHPLSFSVVEGEAIAFIGPNGAGKSTTIKMLTGILHPTSGNARVLGFAPWRERVALSYRIGTVFGQKSQLWYNLPPADTFDLMARIYDIARSDYLERRASLVRAFGLAPHMGTPVRKLSLGERMRAEIAAALLHRPRVLFLDEPTIGLDVVVKQTIRELISELNREEGVTVFLTSHDPGDIETLCSRALVIHQGMLLFDAGIDELKRRFYHHKTVRLHLRRPAPALSMPGVEVEEADPLQWRLRVDISRQRIEAVLAAALQHCEIEDVTVENPGFEYAIAQMYKGAERSGTG